MHYLLQDLTWEDARALAKPASVVVLPMGAIEQHGPHLPVEVDTRCASTVAERAARLAGGQIDVIVAPSLHFGASHHHLAFPGTMSISLPIYVQVLVDLAESLVAGGFRHVFLLNGHGGNADPMRVAVRMLRDRYPDLVAAAACYWDLASAEINRLRRSNQGGMSHACELETSLMMHLRPETVKRERIAPSRPRWRSPWLVGDLAAGGSGVTTGYHIDDVAPTGVMGDPELASPEAGAEFLEAISARVAEFLVDFSSWRIEALTEHD